LAILDNFRVEGIKKFEKAAIVRVLPRYHCEVTVERYRLILKKNFFKIRIISPDFKELFPFNQDYIT